MWAITNILMSMFFFTCIAVQVYALLVDRKRDKAYEQLKEDYDAIMSLPAMIETLNEARKYVPRTKPRSVEEEEGRYSSPPSWPAPKR